MITQVRAPAVAGLFYPAEAQELRQMIQGLLRQTVAATAPAPKAMIVPHAGYVYSGAIAATAYARLAAVSDTITRVILLGPSHRLPFMGLAATRMTHFATPLAQVAIDHQAIDSILTLPQVTVLDEAHLHEHSLEVHLPFLQEVLTHFTLVPLVVGEATPQQVSDVLEQLWGGKETLIVVSSDLSHYYDYQTAQQLDQSTSQAIEHLHFEAIEHQQACGYHPLKGLLYFARDHALKAQTLDLRNSGDTAGPKHQVVGYGAYVFN
ncbi:MAG: AmmeMemoRadiSam system protein B [Pseudomonadota bacterium]|nr:AmmeMemoRadiSam system protein B [Pseudomonadota bacterium]